MKILTIKTNIFYCLLQLFLVFSYQLSKKYCLLTCVLPSYDFACIVERLDICVYFSQAIFLFISGSNWLKTGGMAKQLKLAMPVQLIRKNPAYYPNQSHHPKQVPQLEA